MDERVKITFNDAQIKKLLDKLLGKIQFPAKILKPIADIYAFKDIVDHFNKEEAPEGKWQPRSDFTQQYYLAIQKGLVNVPEGIAGRSSYSPSNKILQLTGTLRNSFVQGSSTINDNSSVIIRSDVDYSGIHDRGGIKDGHKIPQRKFMWLSDKAKKSIARAVLDELLKD
jgi:phage gpG-like protein